MAMARQDRKGYQRAVTGFRRDARGAMDAGTLLRKSTQLEVPGEEGQGRRTVAQSEFLERFASELAKDKGQ